MLGGLLCAAVCFLVTFVLWPRSFAVALVAATLAFYFGLFAYCLVSWWRNRRPGDMDL